MKLNLPLPNKEKQLTWTKDLEQRLGVPFQSAKHWKVSFTDSDVKYIESVIKNHKLYRIIYKQGAENTVLDTSTQIHRYKAEMEFMTLFMNDAKCPKNVNNFLYLYIGNLRAMLQENGYRMQQLARDNFFIDMWMETCR